MTGAIRGLGVLGVFALMVPESACIPVPSEVTLLFSGFAVHEGWMSFPRAVIAATAGNLVGSLLAYAIGTSRLLDRVPGAGAVLRRWGALLDRYGLRAVFIARLLPLARTFVSLPAGVRRVPLAPFVALTTAGCALWALALVLVGVAAGAGWSAVSSVIAHATIAVGIAALLLALTRRARKAA